MTSDYELYINTIQCINNNELDKAWGIIQSFNSKELKDSFTKDNTKHNSIMYDVIYEGCDGNLHVGEDYPSSNSGGGGDCCSGIIGGIICGIISICCSISMGECCWCAAWNQFWSCAECCKACDPTKGKS